MKFKKIAIAILLTVPILVMSSSSIPAREPSKAISVPKELFKSVDPDPLKDQIVFEPQATLVPIEIKQVTKPTIKPKPKINLKAFLLDRNVSWYGPGFYGKRTACGYALTKTLLGVAHKTLPCGTKVTFSWKGRTITVPVVDRGPYVSGRQWDLTGGLCVALRHCFTGPIYYRIGK